MALAAVRVVAASEPITLSAPAGEFRVKTIGPSSAVAHVSVALTLVELDGTNAWPPAAYVGFYQGPDRKESIQFLIIRNKEADNYLVAGYRLIEHGKETEAHSLHSFPLDAVVLVRLGFDGGIVYLWLDGTDPIRLTTPFKKVAPYVSVSSGTARFKVDP